jgi:transmembrane sensor
VNTIRESFLARGISGSKTRLEEAADWLARRKAGLNDGEQAEYRRWLAADSRNAAAMAEIRSTWEFLERPRLAGQNEQVMRGIAARAFRQAALRRRWAKGVSIAGLMAAAVVARWFLPARNHPSPAPAVASAGSPTADPEVRKLPDGSVVELKAGAKIDIDFSAEQRLVRLVGGEAHFRIVRNPRRPFVVDAGAVCVRDIGTAFAVSSEPEKVDVLVTEGEVEVEQNPATVRTPATAPTPVFLDANHRLTVPLKALANAPWTGRAVGPEEIASALAWRKAKVEFTNTPLSDALELFNRRNRIQLTLSDSTLGDIRITGIFWTDDPQGFVRLLHASAGMEVVRQDESQIMVGKP